MLLVTWKANLMVVTAYGQYSEWKGWAPDAFMSITAHETLYFQGELQDLPLNGARVLEIGFGNGVFMRFAVDQGAIIEGTELLEEAVACATQRGIRTYHFDLSDAVRDSAGQLDLIAAFDVLEHMTYVQIIDLFESLAVLLKPGGHVIARFPNGQSPLGRSYQHADHTHRSVISPPLLMQLLFGRPWVLVRAQNPFAVIHEGRLIHRVGLRLRRTACRLAEFAVNRLYGLEITLDPNVIVLLRRS
jgi:2-polyprenyl-3-methyl-5-hydroxy-6-metoxy-1,4-benzoquinol methylase